MSHLNSILVQSIQAFKYITSTNQNNRLRQIVFQSTSRMKDYAYKSWRAVGITASVREPIIVLFILTIFFIQLHSSVN